MGRGEHPNASLTTTALSGVERRVLFRSAFAHDGAAYRGSKRLLPFRCLKARHRPGRRLRPPA
jgi:hypothetical protein